MQTVCLAASSILKVMKLMKSCMSRIIANLTKEAFTCRTALEAEVECLILNLKGTDQAVVFDNLGLRRCT